MTVLLEVGLLLKKVKMNKLELELANDIKRLAVAMEKLVKIMTKAIKDNA